MDFMNKLNVVLSVQFVHFPIELSGRKKNHILDDSHAYTHALLTFGKFHCSPYHSKRIYQEEWWQELWWRSVASQKLLQKGESMINIYTLTGCL